MKMSREQRVGDDDVEFIFLGKRRWWKCQENRVLVMMLSINSWTKDVDENVKRTEKLCGRLDFIATVGFGNCDQATWVLSKTAMLSFLTNCLNPSHTFSVWAEYNLAQPYLIAVNRWKTNAVTDFVILHHSQKQTHLILIRSSQLKVKSPFEMGKTHKCQFLGGALSCLAHIKSLKILVPNNPSIISWNHNPSK